MRAVSVTSARAHAVPHNGPQGRLETDFHVQRVGALEVDAQFGVPDDEVVDQGEGVFVDGVGSVSLWHKDKSACMSP